MNINEKLLYMQDKEKLEYTYKQILEQFAYAFEKKDSLDKYINLNEQELDAYFNRNLYLKICSHLNKLSNKTSEKLENFLNIDNNIKDIDINDKLVQFNYNSILVVAGKLFSNKNNNNIYQMIDIVKSAKNSKIVIGYIMGYTTNTKELYFWIEKDDFVIDILKNTIFNTSGFYKITSAVVLDKIDSDTLNNQSSYYKFLKQTLNLDDKTYLVFNKELKKELETKKLI